MSSVIHCNEHNAMFSIRKSVSNVFHAVIMPFHFFLGKFSLKQNAVISRYTSAFQRELHDYFSLSLNKNQNQHPKHRAKNQWIKKKLFCWENGDYGQSHALYAFVPGLGFLTSSFKT